MSEFIVLLAGIIFFILGKYSQFPIEKEIIKKFSRPKFKSGVIDLKSPAEINEELSKSDAEKQSEQEMNKLLSKVVNRV